MWHKFIKIRFSIKVTVLTLFILLALLIISIALSLQYHFSHALAKEASQSLFDEVARSINQNIHSLDLDNSTLAYFLSNHPDAQTQMTDESIRPIISVMRETMSNKSVLQSMYIGYDNGDYYGLVNIDSNQALKVQFNASANDHWAIIHINSTEKRISYHFFNNNFELTHQITTDRIFDVRDTLWYKSAIIHDDTIKTTPYQFRLTQISGITYARKVPGTKNVVGINVSVEVISQILRENKTLKENQNFIFDNDGRILAHSAVALKSKEVNQFSRIPLSENETNYLKTLGKIRVSNELNWAPFDFTYGGQPQGYSIDIMNIVAKKLGLDLEYSNGYSWKELTDLFNNDKIDVIHTIFYTSNREKWGHFTSPYLDLPGTLITASTKSVIKDLRDLNGYTIAVTSGSEFADLMSKQYPMIKLLHVADSIDALHAVINGKAFAAMDSKAVVEYLINLYSLQGLALHSLGNQIKGKENPKLQMLVSKDKDKLAKLINKALKSIPTDVYQNLSNKWLVQSIKASVDDKISLGVVPSPEFLTMANLHESRTQGSSSEVEIGGQEYTLFVQNIGISSNQNIYFGMIMPTHVILAPYVEKIYISIAISLLVLMILLPYILYVSELIVGPIKLLSIENQKIHNRKYNEVKIVPTRIKELYHLSKSIKTMSISISEQNVVQQELMDSFIQLIAEAIDQKSPYTGTHCARVPALAIMLVESANKSSLPPFSQFQLITEDQWREFKIAAWLHDCGKVTSPEHIIDKGSKLETIYNRINEIRMRFEVLWRDADIAYWCGIAGGESEHILRATRAQRQETLTNDFAFIAQCNIGGEFMDEDKIDRIITISGQTWVRHFSDRLGLSPEESRRLAKLPEAPLPVNEKLLDDKPEHIHSWEKHPKDSISDDIKMDIPDIRANLGEIHNLSIRKGTLTESDRYRINEHIIATIRMLESLPFPKELSRIPEIAGGHHETLKGTGYPKRLNAESLSIEARILAIADVFEALTAADRPYKNAKKLSEAISILARMARDQHLDNDLFKLLLSSGVYMTYAQQFLDPSQIDAVDIAKYLEQ